MILVLCGPPASGKSTMANELVGRLESVKVITSDEFKRKTYKRLFEQAEIWAGKVECLVLNGTFYKHEWRDEIHEIAHRKSEHMLVVRIKCSLQTCLKRNRSREQSIPENAVRLIYDRFEEPDAPDLLVDTDLLSVDEAAERIMDRILAEYKDFVFPILDFDLYDQ